MMNPAPYMMSAMVYMFDYETDLGYEFSEFCEAFGETGPTYPAHVDGGGSK